MVYINERIDVNTALKILQIYELFTQDPSVSERFPMLASPRLYLDIFFQIYGCCWCFRLQNFASQIHRFQMEYNQMQCCGKKLGANFAKLVTYPKNHRILNTACFKSMEKFGQVTKVLSIYFCRSQTNEKWPPMQLLIFEANVASSYPFEINGQIMDLTIMSKVVSIFGTRWQHMLQLSNFLKILV